MDFKLLVGNSGGSGLGNSAAAASLGIDSDGCLPSLTLKQRITGCVACFAIGMVISMCATLSLTDPTRFGTLYTVGNILSLSSTALLFGPVRQIKNMFARKRALATIMYLVTLAATLGVAIGVSYSYMASRPLSEHWFWSGANMQTTAT